MAACAKRAGMSASTLSRIAAGHRPPTAGQPAALAKALGLEGEERAEFERLGLLARAPEGLGDELVRLRGEAGAERARRTTLEQGYGAYRASQAFHDGWWLTCSHAFAGDGRLQRSLLRVEGDRADLVVRDGGRVRFRYHGAFEVLGDKVFARLSEDRGAIEYVQITCHSLFDAGEPSLLLGLVCGITGTDLAHPTSEPAAARVLLLWAGPLTLPQAVLARLDASLGIHQRAALGPCWPSFLGDDLRLRSALGLSPRDDLDRALLRLVDNGLRGTCTVLRARPG